MALKEYDFDKEPTVSVVKKILTDSIKMKATDIHFDPQPNDLLIRFRINGSLVEYTIVPENVRTNIITRVKILANMNITESLIPQVGGISFEVDGSTTNMRVSSLPVSNGEKLVIHIANYAKNIKSISKIGINQNDVAEIKQLLKEPQGIILITGTTSSGKTTTMYSILKEINNKSINIISIEDPIKMKIEGVNQVQIAPEKGLTYKSILRNVLLQDPNVICINELVDDETARSAIRASVTGRLVLSTMHTKNAYTTIEALLNMDVENYLLGSNLVGIISQRLVKKLCPNCCEKRKASEYEKKVIKYILNKDIEELYYPKGCTECQNGYIDQLPVIEVVTIDDELRSAISNNKSRELIRNIIYENSNSILKDGFEKAIAGETSFNEIIRITDVKIDFTKEEKEIKEYILGNGQTELTLPTENKPIEEEKNLDEEKVPTTDEEKILKALNSLEQETKEKVEEEKNNEETTESTTTEETKDEDSQTPTENSTNNESPEEVKENTSDENKDDSNEEEIQIVKVDGEEENSNTENEKDKPTTEEPKEETPTSEENKEEKDEISINININNEETNEEKTEESSNATEEPTNVTKETKDDDDSTDTELFANDDDDDDFNYNNSYSIF